MKRKIRIGYVGLGRRGRGVLSACIMQMADVEVAYLCDIHAPAMEAAVALFEKAGRTVPRQTADYREILADGTVDAVFLMTGWDGRMTLVEDSLLAGKYTAVEVGCAFTLEECLRVKAAHEKTGAHLMMLENCCYGRREMMGLRLALEGAFGELVHCDGGYHHYLPACELFLQKPGEGKHYRLPNYEKRNCEQYPTHALGPISKVLGIGRGNRFLSLASFSSKSRGLRAAAEHILGEDSPEAKAEYAQGDIVTTILTCAGGETVHLCLDTTLPRAYYSRNFTVRGTLGMYTEERRVLFFEGMEEKIENNEEEMYKTHDHPLYREYTSGSMQGGHGGIDYLVCRAFVEAVKRGEVPPINTYDSLTWMAIAPLSEASIRAGGAPVEFPDFSDGAWQTPGEPLLSKYSLDAVFEDAGTPIFPAREDAE
ncbi:MAG: Gfo/Idh/MocA family oxidoreductase [Clostridia bacterium]|nr:Gfo/Idh/MocA family oxidoreductase [Clostridia bacterium]